MEKEIFNRLVKEFQDLNEKVEKLKEFILNKEKFDALDMINKDLLIAQFKSMETYLSILSIRLGLNAKSENVENEEVVEDTITEEING